MSFCISIQKSLLFAFVAVESVLVFRSISDPFESNASVAPD
ncbi:hypothetical protein [Haladaptatus sp. W1]|nr:hypothetical protein [Haladaptatus sp. W1]